MRKDQLTLRLPKNGATISDFFDEQRHIQNI